MADKRGISGKALGRLGNFHGAPPFLLHYNSSSSAGTTNTDTIFDANVPFRFRIVNCWAVMSEAGNTDAETFKLTDGTNDITDAPACQGLGDTDLVHVGEIDNAYYELDVGDSLKVVKAATTAVIAMEVYILCVRV